MADVGSERSGQHGLGLRAATNSLFVLGGSIVSRLASLVVLGYLARRFSAGGLASYNLTLVYSSFATILGDLGITAYVGRGIAAEPGRARELLRQGAVASFAAGAVSMLICNVAAIAAGYSSQLRGWILISTSSSVLGTMMLPMAMLQARLQGAKVAVIAIAGQLLSVTLVIFVVAIRGGIELVVVLQVAVTLVMGSLVLIVSGAWRWILPIPKARDIAAGLRMLGSSIGLAAVQMLAFIPARLDTVVLSVVAGGTGVGYYSGAWRLSEAFHLIPTAVMASVFPIASRSATLPVEALARTLWVAFRYLALVGIPLAVGIVVIARPTVTAIYGTSLRPAAGPLRVLGIDEAVFFFGSVAASALIGLRLTRPLFLLGVVVVPLNIIACVSLLPVLGYRAASWITLGTELAGTSWMTLVLRRRLATRFLPVRSIIRAALASLLMGGVLALLSAQLKLSLVLSVLTAIPAYVAGLLALQELGKDDLLLARRIATSRRRPPSDRPTASGMPSEQA